MFIKIKTKVNPIKTLKIWPKKTPHVKDLRLKLKFKVNKIELNRDNFLLLDIL